jgi:radical SAM protein with 4Fe4S-binding SPASM domain
MSEVAAQPAQERPQVRAARLGVPFRVHFIVTHKCNLACAHCYQAEHDSRDLSFDEVKAVLEQLARMGVLFLVLGGGEPMARRDFWEIVAEARRLRFSVELYTNGTLLDAERAARLKALGVAPVSVSLHGAHAETHDAFVRQPGAFDRVNRAIDACEAVGLPVSVKSTMTRQNAASLPGLLEKFAGRPVLVSLNSPMFPRDDGDPTPLLYRPTEEQERGVVRAQLERMPRDQFERMLENARKAGENDGSEAPCEAGRTIFSIHPNGDVSPCNQTSGMVMGNVKQRPVAEIWADSQPGARFRATTRGDFEAANAECGSCPFKHVCQRCAAMSQAETGSFTGHSAQKCRSTKVYWTEVRRRAELLGIPCPV